MLRRVVERARAIVVHNPEAARIAAAAGNGPRTMVEIPHLFQPPAPLPTESQVERYRQRLGVEPGAYLFGVFGYLRESKRLSVALETFARLRREQPRAALLVAGGFVSTDLERAVGPLLQAPGVIRRPHLTGARIPAGGGLRGRLHQPALSGRRRDFRHCHPADGSGQTHAGDHLKIPSSRAAPPQPAPRGPAKSQFRWPRSGRTPRDCTRFRLPARPG